MSNNDIISGVAAILEKSLIRRGKSKLYVLLGFIAVLAAVAVYIGPQLKSLLSGAEDTPPIAVINEMTDGEKAELLKNKAIEIKKSVLGEARQRKELLVLEQDIRIESLLESTPGGFDIFKKTKKVVSYGTGYYNIDLSGLDENSISVDNEKFVVTIRAPHATLKSISVDEGKTEYEDTQKGGMLGFGELKLTAEQQGLLQKTVEDNMRAELEKPEMLEQADVAGKASVTEIYQPLISAISDEYHVEVIIGNP